MVAIVAVVAAFATGCAIGHVVRPDGTAMTGWAIGHAKVECCVPTGGGVLTNPEACERIEGGALSSTVVELLSTLATAAAAYFTGGAL